MALLQMDFSSQCLQRTVTIDAILPVDQIDEDGRKPKKPYKTLYLLHGMLGNYRDWISETRLKIWARESHLAVILPSGENHFYVDCKATGERYGEFIGKELVEITRSLFPLSEKREDTFLAGLSMGGYGALRNGLKYQETFGAIGAFSSGLIQDKILRSTNEAENPWERRSFYETIFGDLEKLPGSDMDCKALILDRRAKRQSIPRIYMACGTEDFLLQENRDFSEFLRKNQVEVTYVETPGGHEWRFWDRHIYEFIRWLPTEKEPGIYTL